MKPQVVSYHCELRNSVGQVISKTFSQGVMTQEGENLPGLAAGMQNLQTGERRRICVPADQAYGLYNPNLVMEAPRNQLPKAKNVKIGDEVPIFDEAGAVRPFRITKLSNNRVWLDGNHPLAGQDLEFDIRVTEARDATVDEIRESSAPETSPDGSWLH